jgi:hypothetical protein
VKSLQLSFQYRQCSRVVLSRVAIRVSSTFRRTSIAELLVIAQKYSMPCTTQLRFLEKVNSMRMGFLLYEDKEDIFDDEDDVNVRDDEPFVSKRSDSVGCCAYVVSTMALVIGIVLFFGMSAIICACSLSILRTSTYIGHYYQVITFGLFIQLVTSIGIFHWRKGVMRKIHQYLTCQNTMSCANILELCAFTTCLGIFCGALVSTNLVVPIFEIENVHTQVLTITGISSLTGLLLMGCYKFDKWLEERKRSSRDIEELNFSECDCRPINWLIDDVVDL